MTSSTDRRIVFLTQHFYPEVTSTGQLLTELAQEMVKRGFTVQVVTRRQSGALLHEEYQGIFIRRVICSNFPKSNLVGRLINDLTFLLSAFIRLLGLNRSDLVFIVSNPPFLPFLGWLLSLIKKNKYIYLVHDIYPDIAVNLGMIKKDGVIQKGWDHFNRRIISRADATVVLGECMRRVISQKVGARNDRIMTIPNWCDEKLISPISKQGDGFAIRYGLEHRFVVLYSGNLGLFQHLEAIIELAERLKGQDDILFLFIGEGGKKPKLQRMVKERGLQNVRFLPYQDRNLMLHSYASADVSIITLEKGAEGLGVPSKLYTIMASGRPVIALLGGGSEVAEVVRRADCGQVVDQDDISGFEKAILNLYNDKRAREKMGNNARRYFEQHFTKTRIMDRYFDLLSRLSKKEG